MICQQMGVPVVYSKPPLNGRWIFVKSFFLHLTNTTEGACRSLLRGDRNLKKSFSIILYDGRTRTRVLVCHMAVAIPTTRLLLKCAMLSRFYLDFTSHRLDCVGGIIVCLKIFHFPLHNSFYSTGVDTAYEIIAELTTVRLSFLLFTIWHLLKRLLLQPVSCPIELSNWV